jgi:N-acetyltransferase
MNFEFNKDIFLENERVLLRPLKENDHEFLLPIAIEDSNLLQYSNYRIHSADLLKNYISHSLQERGSNIRYPLVIFDKTKNAFAGSTSFANVSNADKRIEIGWTWLAKDFQQTGLNPNCKLLLMQYAFEVLEFERVEIKTDERNLVSRKAIEKLGAVYEGALRSHIALPDGFRRTTVYYSILKDEWGKVKQGLIERINNQN